MQDRHRRQIRLGQTVIYPVVPKKGRRTVWREARVITIGTKWLHVYDEGKRVLLDPRKVEVL